MITRIASEDRFRVDAGWLDARWHFSFGHYRDPKNVHWGALRVFNDDVVKPGGAFDMHPHDNMEIISFIYEGGLEHKDSMGNSHVTTRGGVQVMSAGTGVMHSEGNPCETDVRLNQIWIYPRHRGLTPRWAEKNFDAELESGEWVTLVSDEGVLPGTLPIDQDAVILAARPQAGKELRLDTSSDRFIYLFVAKGEVELGGVRFSEGDQARIAEETALSIQAVQASEILLIDLPAH